MKRSDIGAFGVAALILVLPCRSAH